MITIKRLCSAAAVALTLAVAAPAAAHPEGHDTPVMTIEKASAEARAKTIVGTLIERKTLEPSWGSVQSSSAQLRAGRNGIEWVVVFQNPKATDAAKRTLYVFLSGDGSYLAANHTGQ